MNVSYKGKEFEWDIRENYDWEYLMDYAVYQELHISAVDESLRVSIPVCFDDDETRAKIRKDLGLTFDVPETITLDFICQVIDWATSYQIRKGFTKDVKYLKFGSGRCYTVLMNCKPLLCAEVDDTCNLFDDAVIFEGYLCIGCSKYAFFVNIATLKYFELDTLSYFGYFREIGEQFYVFTGYGIIAFDRNMKMLWRNDKLAVDGVTGGVLSEDGKILEVSCCLDPYPAVWTDNYIDTETGRVL